MIESDPTRASIRIDEGDSHDLDAVMAIMDAAFDPRFGEAWTRSQCAGILPMTGVSLVVAWDADKHPLGFSLSRTIIDEAELLLIAVDPGHRRCGIGGRLLDRFMEQARSHGASRVHLEVRDGNPALQMYQQNGFEPIRRRKNYYRGSDQSQFDALTLSRDI